jgi:Immunity protein Imm1
MTNAKPSVLSGDRWDNEYNFDWRDENPTYSDFDFALERLDAKTYTMLTIQLDGDAHLTIAGGAGQYVVYATYDNEEFWNLLRPEAASGTVMLNAGGQEGDFSASQVVNLEDARSAGLYFLTKRRLDFSQNWEKQ